MKNFRMAGRMGSLLLVLALAAACDDSDDITAPQDVFAGRTIFGIDGSNNLVSFAALTPGTRASIVAITGLAAGETVVGIDFRPSSDVLFAVSSSSRLYTVNTGTGAATAVANGTFAPPLNGSSFGIGFNPQVDRLRIHTNAEQNLRINQTASPLVVLVDGPLAYKVGDVNFGRNPNTVGTAYTLSNNPAPTSTELYAIDSDGDVMVELDLPNDGQMTTVGSLGFDTSADVGFDIAGDTDVGYASLTPAGAATGPSRLYTVNLRTGLVSGVGIIGHPTPLRSIAVAPGLQPTLARFSGN